MRLGKLLQHSTGSCEQASQLCSLLEELRTQLEAEDGAWSTLISHGELLLQRQRSRRRPSRHTRQRSRSFCTGEFLSFQFPSGKPRASDALPLQELSKAQTSFTEARGLCVASRTRQKAWPLCICTSWAVQAIAKAAVEAGELRRKVNDLQQERVSSLRA